MRSKARQDAIVQPAGAADNWRRTPSMSIEKTQLGLQSSPTYTLASIYSSASSLVPIRQSQTCHVSVTDPATGDPEAGFPRMYLKAAYISLTPWLEIRPSRSAHLDLSQLLPACHGNKCLKTTCQCLWPRSLNGFVKVQIAARCL